MTTADASNLLLLSKVDSLLPLRELRDENSYDFAVHINQEYYLPYLHQNLNRKQLEVGTTRFGEDSLESKICRVDCSRLAVKDCETNKNFSSINEKADATVSFGTPILTNVVTKEGMAIIRVDHAAITMLRQVSRHTSEVSKNNLGLLQIKHASTEPFQLSINRSHVTLPNDAIDVAFKLYVDGCDTAPGKVGKFVSVFLEMKPKDPNMKWRPLVVTIFLQNLKDGNGNSYNRSFKIQDAGDGFPLERGFREFVHMEDFDSCLDKVKNEGTLAFGVKIQAL